MGSRHYARQIRTEKSLMARWTLLVALLRVSSVEQWEKGMEGEVIGMAVNVEDERSVTGKGGREMAKRPEGSRSREDVIKVCLCARWNDSTGREDLIMQESGSLKDRVPDMREGLGPGTQVESWL